MRGKAARGRVKVNHGISRWEFYRTAKPIKPSTISNARRARMRFSSAVTGSGMRGRRHKPSARVLAKNSARGASFLISAQGRLLETRTKSWAPSRRKP